MAIRASYFLLLIFSEKISAYLLNMCHPRSHSLFTRFAHGKPISENQAESSASDE
jgi:hypothetical protein